MTEESDGKFAMRVVEGGEVTSVAAPRVEGRLVWGVEVRGVEIGVGVTGVKSNLLDLRIVELDNLDLVWLVGAQKQSGCPLNTSNSFEQKNSTG